MEIAVSHEQSRVPVTVLHVEGKIDVNSYEQFKLLNPQPSVLEILKTTGFDLYLEIHHNLRDAVASF